MKNIYFAEVFILIFFTGCSSTYKVKNFSTKEKFYEEFNNSFKNREAKVVLTNDSTFIALNGVDIKNDTLYSYIFTEENQPMQFSLADVADIEFISDHIASAKIFLKNGEKLNGNKVKVTKDSINFIESKSLMLLKKLESIDKIKRVTYKNRWKRMPLAILAGAPLGAFSGIVFSKLLDTRDYKGNPDYFIGVINMTVVGVLTGCITSYLIGFDYIYQFNP